MNSRILVLALAPAMLIAGPLLAEETASKPDRAAHKAAAQEKILARFDKDGDGKLSEEEKAAAREAMAQNGGGPLQENFMRRYDADKDGKLSDAEKAKAETDWKTFVGKHDKDGDGKLSPDEARAAREAWAKEHPEAAAKMREAAVEHYDHDGDGELSRQERKEMRKDLHKKRKDAKKSE